MRNAIVAGIGGLVVGHVLWLIAISLAVTTASVSSWVLAVAVLSLLGAGVAAVYGWRHYQQKSTVSAAFLWCLAVSPVLMSLAVLGVTYL